MAVDIRALITKKNEKHENKKLVLEDVNRDLIVALLGISVYGKEARDDEILNIIINNGVAIASTETYDKIKARYKDRVSKKEIKRSKDGTIKDKNGFIVLVPR